MHCCPRLLLQGALTGMPLCLLGRCLSRLPASLAASLSTSLSDSLVSSLSASLAALDSCAGLEGQSREGAGNSACYAVPLPGIHTSPSLLRLPPPSARPICGIRYAEGNLGVPWRIQVSRQSPGHASGLWLRVHQGRSHGQHLAQAPTPDAVVHVAEDAERHADPRARERQQRSRQV